MHMLLYCIYICSIDTKNISVWYIRYNIQYGIYCLVQYTFSRVIYWGCVFCCNGVRHPYHISYMVMPSRITLNCHHHSHEANDYDHDDDNHYAHQRMRKMKARPRQSIPMNFSSLQQRLSIAQWATLISWKSANVTWRNTSAKYEIFWIQTQIEDVFKIQIQMLPGEIQMQGETANNPSPVEEKPGQQ